jgi:hypothetical protein
MFSQIPLGLGTGTPHNVLHVYSQGSENKISSCIGEAAFEKKCALYTS